MRLLSLIAALGIVACSSRSEPPAPVGESAAQLRLVPATAVVGGRTYQLESFLWRDFMPGPDVGSNGRPLIATVRVGTSDKSLMPVDVVVDGMWVVNGDEVWRATPREEQPRSEPTKFEVVARDGPRWGPGITVDVVVRLRASGGENAFVRAAGQPINRTD